MIVGDKRDADDLQWERERERERTRNKTIDDADGGDESESERWKTDEEEDSQQRDEVIKMMQIRKREKNRRELLASHLLYLPSDSFQCGYIVSLLYLI